VGAEFVAKAAPDGHTLLLVSMSTVAINPATYKSLPYDVDRDFAPIALLCSYGAVVYGRGTLPVNDISGLLALAKASPGRVSYGSAGNGSQGHFGGAMLDMMAGTKMTHVPYKGAAPAMTDVVAGRIDFLITGVTPAWTEFVKSGKLKMLATGGIKRSSEFPSIPTVAETLPGFLNGTIFSLFTRAGLPNAVLMRLNSETNRALKSPEVKGRLEGLGFDVPADSTPESLAQLVASEKARYIKLVREAKIEIE